MTDDDNPAHRYDEAAAAGQGVIRERWGRLSETTRAVLARSGFYSARGERLKVEHSFGDDPRADTERLEHALGMFKQCISSKVPMRSEKGAPIPHEALTDDVLLSCEELLYVLDWHDPEFLRLALGAVAAHQQANALKLAGPSSSGTGLGALAVAGLLLITPLALAAGVVAAFEHNVVGAAVAFYVVGGGVLAAVRGQEPGKNLSPAERTHLAWWQFRYLQGGAVVGAGARFQLERMAVDGVNVPPVAFDICAALQHRSLGTSVTPSPGSAGGTREVLRELA